MGYFVQQNCVEGSVGREKEALVLLFKLGKEVSFLLYFILYLNVFNYPC